jgi:hypothetical protein
MKSSTISANLLQKYVDEACTESEKKLVDNWYGALKGASNYLDSLSKQERTTIQAEVFEHIR